jgi:hypothetical protein
MDSHTQGQPQPPTTVAPPTMGAEQIQQEMELRTLKANQNLGLGILGGIGGAAIGATLWAVVTALTNFQIGWMAVGVGFLVGYAVRYLGQGVDVHFGIIGAAFSLLGCLAGNLLTVCIVVARQENMPLMDLLSRLTPAAASELLTLTFSPIDLLFYGIAVYEGFRFAIKRPASS